MHEARKLTLPVPTEHRLRNRLRRFNLSMWQLGEICGVSRGYISQMLCGTSPMPIEIEQKLEDLLKQLEVENG